MVDPSGTFEFYDFAAGWFSGVCGLLVGHPADTVKVRQQTQGNRGALPVILSIFKSEGPFGFYKGLLMPLLSAGMINSVFFGCYGNSVRLFAHLRDERPKRTCCDSIHTRPTYKNFHSDVFFAGCLAGAITTLGACPFDLVKIKLQTQYEHLKLCKKKHLPFEIYSGSFDCLVKLYKAGGLRFVYKGLVPMLWRDVPTYGLYTLVYEHTLCLCEYHTPYHTNAPLCVILGGCMADISASGVYMNIYVFGSENISETKTASAVMISGGLAGVTSWALIMPLDVVKSRVQADSHLNPKYKSTIDCFKKTYREGGLRIFMTGFWTTMVRALPVNAALFFGYETFISLYLRYVKPSVQ